MRIPAMNPGHPGPAAETIEGIARVVRVEGADAWLEPEQTTSCGHCSAAAACGMSGPGADGIGTIARRIEARRFRLDADAGGQGLDVGDRVVVGVAHGALLKAALVAYALPLCTALAGGVLAQALAGDDATTMLAMTGSLAAGLLAARLGARRLAARGQLAPRFLRRARPGETCGT